MMQLPVEVATFDIGWGEYITIYDYTVYSMKQWNETYKR